MRTGINPQKIDFKVEMKSNHRIVMVIFIPNLENYYQKMLEVIKLSIESLIKTIPNTSKITLVDNGSCGEVRDFLLNLYKQQKIDSLQLHAENIGKIDALIGAARASREPIITLSDCDILFKPNWVSETIQVFNSFYNVASVSPIPVRKGFNYYTFSVQETILRRKIDLKFESKKDNFKEYNLFLQSINWDLETDDSKSWPIVSSKNTKAIIGSDHQIVTVRRDILFNNSPKEPSLIKVGRESERNYVDYAIDVSGGLRLSTYNYYAFHMGNELEDWMIKSVDEYKQQFIETPQLSLIPKLKYITKNDFCYKLKKKLIKQYFKIKLPLNY